MSTLPSPPFIPVEGIANFRDVGGYASTASPSSSIRRHYLYRCADPSPVTEAGKTTIQHLGIKALFDLRSRPEIEKTAAVRPVVEFEGVTRHLTPAFSDQDYGPEAIAERYRDYAEGGVAVCVLSSLCFEQDDERGFLSFCYATKYPIILPRRPLSTNSRQVSTTNASNLHPVRASHAPTPTSSPTRVRPTAPSSCTSATSQTSP